MHPDRERLAWTCAMVDPVFPGTRRRERVQLLGIGPGFPHQAPVHLARGQVGSLHRGGMRTDHGRHASGITLDHFDRDPAQATPRTGLDHRKLRPLLLGAFDGRWSAHAAVFRYLPPGLDQRLAIITFSISRHRRRRIRMPPIVALGQQIARDLRLGLADRAPNAQARSGIQRYAAPEGAAVICRRTPPFSPV